MFLFVCATRRPKFRAVSWHVDFPSLFCTVLCGAAHQQLNVANCDLVVKVMFSHERCAHINRELVEHVFDLVDDADVVDACVVIVDLGCMFFFCVRGFFVVMVCAACGCRVENASQTRCGWIRAIPAVTSGQQPGTYPDDAQDALPGALTWWKASWWLFVCNDCLDFCYSGLVRLYPSRFNSYWYRTVRIFHGPHGPAAMLLAWSDERKAKKAKRRRMK